MRRAGKQAARESCTHRTNMLCGHSFSRAVLMTAAVRGLVGHHVFVEAPATPRFTSDLMTCRSLKPPQHRTHPLKLSVVSDFSSSPNNRTLSCCHRVARDFRPRVMLAPSHIFPHENATRSKRIARSLGLAPPLPPLPHRSDVCLLSARLPSRTTEHCAVAAGCLL